MRSAAGIRGPPPRNCAGPCDRRHYNQVPMSLSQGTRLGPYEILGALGAGGMGEVYKARDTRLDRTVAIKVLPALSQADPGSRARFEREAKVLASFDHPHICALHDVGREGA